MDKGFKRFAKGRVSIAVALAACLMLLALPAFAYAATFGSPFPANGAVLGGQPGMIGVQVSSNSAAIVLGSISVDGTRLNTSITAAGTTQGHWTPTYTVSGSGYTVTWAWTAAGAGSDGTAVTLWAYPSTLSLAVHTVTASVTDTNGVVTTMAGPWSFTINGSPVVITPPPAAVPTAGCATGCHDGILWSAEPGMSSNCVACHSGLDTPPHGFFTGAHTHADLAAGMALTSNTSYACARCHGTDLTAIGLVTGEHAGCSCHNYHEATDSVTGCASCHKGGYGAHGFDSATALASGHNTTTYGGFGAHTKWDGSEGGVVVTNTAGATITQDWPLPTADVFWSQSNNGSTNPTDSINVVASVMGLPTSAFKTTVGWGSTITCQDCHTGLSAAGPHGAAQNWGLDPNFPDDWTTAELTSYDPTGMRSVATTVGTPNPYYVKTWVNGTSTPSTAGSGYSFGDLPGHFICQKCHKLVNYKQGYPIQNRSGRSQQGMGVSNTAHMEHHPDQILGQANCVSCHIAIPHGWKRPRLLVYSSDPAPYVAAQPTTQTVVTIAGLGTFKGNWTYVSSTAGTSRYIDAIYAGTYSSPGFSKEPTSGPAASGWDQSVAGIEWVAPGSETGENEGQPNCNACSATGATHTTASEGVPAGAPTWK